MGGYLKAEDALSPKPEGICSNLREVGLVAGSRLGSPRLGMFCLGWAVCVWRGILGV